MNVDYLSPIKEKLFEETITKFESCIANRIQIYSKSQGFPNLNDDQIVILGVKENRKSINNDGYDVDLSVIRQNLYQLQYGNWSVEIADIGNIEKGNTIEDTYFAVSDIISSLIKRNITVLIIGGSQDITYANYRAYDVLEQMVNLVSVDSRFDIGTVEDKKLTSNSYLSNIVMEEPNNLFNYSNIGYQTYFNSQEEIDLLDKLYFESYRLGEVKNLELVEPILRDADIVSVDISAVRYSDAPASYESSPNGFYGEELCAIARYAGVSDKISSFGVYNYVEHLDSRTQTGALIAQVLWYFIEGFNNRAKDFPFSSKKYFHKFIVVFEDDEPINFYKSDKSGRWWMEINMISDNKYKRHALIPCSYTDYCNALSQKIPERWYKAQQKLT